jgi:transposase
MTQRMVYKHISKDLKERALWLLEYNYIPADVSDIFGVSERSLQRWKANQAQYGSVVPPALAVRGRPRILNADMTHDLFTLLEEGPELFLDEIQEWLALAYDTGISRTALHENIRDAGLTYKLLRKAAAERDEDAREEWMAEMGLHFVARQLVMVDETSKDDRTIYRHYGRAPASHRATIQANFVRGERYSMVAAMSLDGYEALSVVPGSVDGEAFFDFIVNDVVRLVSFRVSQYLISFQLPKMNPYPQDNSVLVLDNCAIHKSTALREVVEAQGQLLVFLPPYSPDFNPIEESFSCGICRRPQFNIFDSFL